MNLVELFHSIDNRIFYLINSHLSSSRLDGFMIMLRTPITWVPFYALMLFLFYKKSPELCFAIVVASIVTFGLTDFISASVFKPFIGRVRPCYDESLNFSVRNIVGCGGRYSMPSSHASNHAGLATFWFLIALKFYKEKWHLLWLWAGAICYAQIYVGVHFPSDILVGALLGMVIAFLIFTVFKKWHKYFLKQQAMHRSKTSYQ